MLNPNFNPITNETLYSNLVHIWVAGHKHGRVVGGKSFSRGALYPLLSNPIYIGQIRHKDKIYEGQHEGIIPIELWTSVQENMANNASVCKGHKTSREINLLKGLLFDAQGTPYTPGYTAKGKKQYRYYISQNLIQMRDHPDGLLGRLPAHEIETAVDDILRAHLRSPEKMCALLNLAQDNNAEVLHKISEIQSSIHMAHLIKAAVEKITVYSERIEITLKVEELVQLFVRISRMHIDCHEENAVIISPYATHRVKKGAVVIEPEKPDRGIFDLPPEQLKKLVQGFIWRDEHFQGLTIRQIADREGLSDSHVGKQIFATFELDQAAA